VTRDEKWEKKGHWNTDVSSRSLRKKARRALALHIYRDLKGMDGERLKGNTVISKRKALSLWGKSLKEKRATLLLGGKRD